VYNFVNFFGFRIRIRIANADTDAGEPNQCGSMRIWVRTLVLVQVFAINLFVWYITPQYRWHGSIQHIIKGGRTAFISLDWPDFLFIGKGLHEVRAWVVAPVRQDYWFCCLLGLAWRWCACAPSPVRGWTPPCPTWRSTTRSRTWRAAESSRSSSFSRWIQLEFL